MNPDVIGNLAWEAILTELIATGNLWDGAKVHLYKNDLSPSPATLLADFVEADFTGYATSSAVVWAAVGFQPDGTALVTGGAKLFATGATPTVLNTVYGWYLTNGAGSVLLFSRRFDTPVVLNGPLQQIIVLPAYAAYVTQ